MFIVFLLTTSDKTFCGDLLYAENKFECEGLNAKSYAGLHPVPLLRQAQQPCFDRLSNLASTDSANSAYTNRGRPPHRLV